MRFLGRVRAAIGRALAWLGALLPSPPSDEPRKPDIDGRHGGDGDPYQDWDATRRGKEGHGGFR